MMLPFARFLDTVGDGSGSIDAAANFSVTPGVFKLTPAASTVVLLDKIRVLIGDTSPFSLAGYGAGAAVATGLDIAIVSAEDETQIVAQVYIALTRHLDLVFAHSEWLTGLGGTDDLLLADLPVLRSIDDSETLRVKLDDDFSSLSLHQFVLYGTVQQ